MYIKICVVLTFFTNKYDAFVWDVVSKDGYKMETHKNVVTADGYRLSLHRIPCGRYKNDYSRNLPVLVVSTFLSSSLQFVSHGPNDSLAYLLADNGFDVWMGDIRSSSYSRDHVNLNPDRQKEFWDFSLTEIGINDLPAMIDYILDYTGYSKLTYYGHSQAAMLFFIMCSETPEYAEKVNLFIATAPTVYMSDVKHPLLRLFAKSWSVIDVFFHGQNIYEIKFSDLDQRLIKYICSLMIVNDLCSQLEITGNKYNTISSKKAQKGPYVLEHFEESIGLKQLVHFLQLIDSGKFQQYDDGYIGNFLKYKNKYPPKYNISGCNIPTAIYYSENDIVVPMKNVVRLGKELPKVIDLYQVPSKLFSHDDFLGSGKDVKKLYLRIVNLIKTYSIRKDLVPE